MKRLIIIILTSIISMTSFAQNDVTKFLGIPVDATKTAMIQKLKEKGYTYNSTLDILEGEFNGQSVEISVVTENNKVYRICLIDKDGTTESQIKIRFNKLCHQFENNSKYLPAKEEQELGEDEDISYEMLVHKKEYQAAFFQIGANESISIYDMTLEEIEKLSKKVVWFSISEQYGKYRIVMFYDNYNNQANGEDL